MSAILNQYLDSSEISSDDGPPTQYTSLQGQKPSLTKTKKQQNAAFRVTNKNLQCNYVVRGVGTKEYTIPEFLIEPNAFIDKSTVLYGRSKTGKTVTTKDIMFNLQPYFPRVWVFAPTGEGTHDYDGVAPKGAMFETVTLEQINDVFEHAKMAKAVYENANNLKVLNKLFSRVASTKAKSHLKKMIDAFAQTKKRLNRKITAPAPRRAAQLKVKDEFETGLRAFYKRVIEPNIQKLRLMRLNDKEKNSLHYLHFNPRTLVIFDDAMTEVASLIKKGRQTNNEVVQNFFFKGRHYNITHIYTMQDDKKLDPALRKNTFISMFTSKSEAVGYFNNKANAFTLEEKKCAESVIDTIFYDGKPKDDHMRMCFIKDSKHKWMWYAASFREPFPMGGTPFRELCSRLEAKNATFDKTNKFHDQFLGYAN